MFHSYVSLPEGIHPRLSGNPGEADMDWVRMDRARNFIAAKLNLILMFVSWMTCIGRLGIPTVGFQLNIMNIPSGNLT